MTTPRFAATLPSPVGPLLALSDGDRLTGLYTEASLPADVVRLRASLREDAAPFAQLVAELDGYFTGRRRTFDVPIAPAGTAFRAEVWTALRAIPFGTTTTYATLARQLGRPLAARAVGAANGKNPIWVVVPCHRVIGADGQLVGYAGGLPCKRFLLDHERRTAGLAA